MDLNLVIICVNFMAVLLSVYLYILGYFGFIVKSASKDRGLDRGMSPAHSANRVCFASFGTC